MRRRDGASPARVPGLGEMRHHIGLAQRPDRLDGHELGIARANSDADHAGGRTHSPALASALTAAAVMALPPMRPRTIRNGMRWWSAASVSLDSAAPTKPTGIPRIAAGRRGAGAA